MNWLDEAVSQGLMENHHAASAIVAEHYDSVVHQARTKWSILSKIERLVLLKAIPLRRLQDFATDVGLDAAGSSGDGVTDVFRALLGISKPALAAPEVKENSFELAPGEIRGIEASLKQALLAKPEDDAPRPKVGAALVVDGGVVATAYRGQMAPGDHAEYCLLQALDPGLDLSTATLVTTLEPCTIRSHTKWPCAAHIERAGIRKVIIGIHDPNPAIMGLGETWLRSRNVAVEMFPGKYYSDAHQLIGSFAEAFSPKAKTNLMQRQMHSPEETFVGEDTTKRGEENHEALESQINRLFDALHRHLPIAEVRSLALLTGLEPDDIRQGTKRETIGQLLEMTKRHPRLTLDAVEVTVRRHWPDIPLPDSP